MGLLDRLQTPGEQRNGNQPSLFAEARSAGGAGGPGFLGELRSRVQGRLVERIDAAKLEEVGYNGLIERIGEVINELIAEDKILLTASDRDRLIDSVTNDMLGLGPLEPLLQDNTISDLLVNGCGDVWIERGGRLSRTEIRFRDDPHLMGIINRIVSRVGRRIDEASPMVDARLPDGSRVNAIIPPLALDGPGLSIRRFGGHSIHIGDLVRTRALTQEMADFLQQAVAARLNVVVCGGTGSGKTTLLNCISTFIPPDQRIITLEDAAELALQQPHVFRLETRPANVEGKGEITMRDLFRNTLRMRPDRVIVGEVRGGEVLDMLQAMSTGHDGSMTTLHANSPRDALSRLELMMLLAGVALPERAMRQYIAGSLHLIVHASRLADGSRRVMRITEITGLEGPTVLTQDLFEFTQTGVAPNGKVIGQFRATQARSNFRDKIEALGLNRESAASAN
ncbi:MAG: CpaF family protein [Candidatus Binataceae bacterium]